MRGTVLVARQDNLGDVLLAGPAVRAVAAAADETVLLAGPRGRAAADLLPGVDRVLTWCAPWIDPDPPEVRDAGVERFVEQVRALGVSEAVLLTSFHQSALPLALLLRMAGVRRIGAISEDYPGSLLDVRHRITGDPPEPERALSVARACGFELPAGDAGRLAVRRPLPDVRHLVGRPGYVVLHPAASVPAREWPVQRCRQAVRALADRGHRVVVTGAPGDEELTAEVSGSRALDLGGRTSLHELAAVLDGADVVIAPNTGPAHLAAAVGTPVVSLFAPVVRAERWAPYGVPAVVLGDQEAPCKDSRARTCPIPGHPCLSDVDASAVVAAVESMLREVAA